VARTFPEHEYFAYQAGRSSGQGDLQNVLRAYAALDPEVGYCQGLNFLAGCILLYCQDVHLAFQVLHVLLIHHNMRVLYVPDLRELQVGRPT
jgi:Rab-GTPase-TBC domain